MVHRPFRLAEIMSKMVEYKIEPKRMRLVYPYIDKELREYHAYQLKFKPKRRRDVKLTAEEMKGLAALEDRGGKSKIDDTK